MALDVMKVMENWESYTPGLSDYWFDGLRNAADQTYLLSTIAQSLDLIAQAAVNLLLRLIAKEKLPRVKNSFEDSNLKRVVQQKVI